MKKFLLLGALLFAPITAAANEPEFGYSEPVWSGGVDPTLNKSSWTRFTQGDEMTGGTQVYLMSENY